MLVRAFAAAACLLTPLAGQAGKGLEARVARALDAARPALLGHLRHAAREHHTGRLALLCLAALHDGVPTDHPVFALALRRLARAELTTTYAVALRLMVLEGHAGFPGRAALAQRDGAALLSRFAKGGFSYTPNPSGWDLSNTQYGVLGLRAAASLGVVVPDARWRELVAAMARAQNDDGGFAYGPRAGHDSYASMTVAGAAVLQMSADALPSDAEIGREVKGRLTRAWQWMGNHKDVLGNHRTKNAYYFHYGLERAAILCDVSQVTGVDWYAAGAEWLIADQRRGGGWVSRTDQAPGGSLEGDRGQPVPTAFAVLFLRRAFSRTPGPITGFALQNLDEQATRDAVEAAAKQAIARGARALPAVLQAARSPVHARRRAAALALETICGESFGYDAAKDVEHNRAAIEAARRWAQERR